MNTYIIRRLLLAIITVILVTLIIFFMVRLVPGDAVDALVSQLAAGGIFEPVTARDEISRSLGLDVSIPIQYGRWIGILPQADGSFSGILQGNLGKSFWRNSTVVEEMAARWPVTLELGIMGLIIGLLIALPIGIYSAIRQDTLGDYIGRSIAILFIAIPSFWLATLVIVFPSIWWGYMPSIKLISFTSDPIGNLKMFIIPALLLGMAMSGGTMRMTRTMMLEVLRQNYIRTAWAKGISEKQVVMRHALKNALIPVISLVGLWLPILIGGAVVIEQIFMLPGVGSLLVEATRFRDYPILSGVMLIFGVGMVLINLFVDLAYSFLDPRIRYQ
jgi:peptide/nickel transport system permease protein